MEICHRLTCPKVVGFLGLFRSRGSQGPSDGKSDMKVASNIRALPSILALVACVVIPTVLAQSDHDNKAAFLVAERDRVIACNARNGTFHELKLQNQEQLLQTAVSDLIAIVVTNKRYLAYSAFSEAWHGTNRQPYEKRVGLQADDSVALVLTSLRILTFNGRTGEWAAERR